MGKRLRKRESLTILMTLLAASKKKKKTAIHPIRAASPERISKNRRILMIRVRTDSTEISSPDETKNEDASYARAASCLKSYCFGLYWELYKRRCREATVVRNVSDIA